MPDQRVKCQTHRCAALRNVNEYPDEPITLLGALPAGRHAMEGQEHALADSNSCSVRHLGLTSRIARASSGITLRSVSVVCRV